MQTSGQRSFSVKLVHRMTLLMGILFFSLGISSAKANPAQASEGYIARQVISMGGGTSSSPSNRISATIGQPIVQRFSAGNRQILSGFWTTPNASACCLDGTGNVDCDPTGEVNLIDITAMVDFLFISNAPLCCFAEANTVRDRSIDIMDLTAMVDYLFLSFSPLSPCRVQ